MLLLLLGWGGCAGRSDDALRRDNERLRAALDAYQRKFGTVETGPARGAVTTVKGTRIGATMGSLDKVRVGDLLSVYRYRYRIGTARVVAVADESCIAEVTEVGHDTAPRIGDEIFPLQDEPR